MAPLYLIALGFVFRDRRWRWILPHALTVLALFLVAASLYAAGNRPH
jgi:hypothetical protein